MKDSYKTYEVTLKGKIDYDVPLRIVGAKLILKGYLGRYEEELDLDETKIIVVDEVR